MKRYDKNNDGILDKDELSQMGGDPQKYDANHDGKVTMDELVAGLKGFSPSSDDADSGGKAKAPTATASSSGGGAKSYGGRRRYLTSADLLPAGLPDRFFKLDTDGDGQIEMSEFATVWSDDKAREFAKYDLNGDGVITADEWLKVDGPKK